jgi:hypothetical protein
MRSVAQAVNRERRGKRDASGARPVPRDRSLGAAGGTDLFSGASGQESFDGHSDFNLQVFSLQLTGATSIPNQG